MTITMTADAAAVVVQARRGLPGRKGLSGPRDPRGIPGHRDLPDRRDPRVTSAHRGRRAIPGLRDLSLIHI